MKVLLPTVMALVVLAYPTDASAQKYRGETEVEADRAVIAMFKEAFAVVQAQAKTGDKKKAARGFAKYVAFWMRKNDGEGDMLIRDLYDWYFTKLFWYRVNGMKDDPRRRMKGHPPKILFPIKIRKVLKRNKMMKFQIPGSKEVVAVEVYRYVFELNPDYKLTRWPGSVLITYKITKGKREPVFAHIKGF